MKDRHGNENFAILNGRIVCFYTWPDGESCQLPWNHEQDHHHTSREAWLNGPETD